MSTLILRARDAIWTNIVVGTVLAIFGARAFCVRVRLAALLLHLTTFIKFSANQECESWQAMVESPVMISGTCT